MVDAELGLYFPMKPVGQELVQRAFEEVGKSIEGAEKAGEELGGSMENLQDSADETGASLEELNKYAGMTKEEFEKGAEAFDKCVSSLDTIGSASDRMGKSLDTLTKTFGVHNQFVEGAVTGFKALGDTMDLVTGTVQMVSGIFQASHTIMTAAQWAFNIAASANPFVLIAMAIIAVLALLYFAWESNFGGIRDVLGGVWEKIQGFWNWLRPILVDSIGGALKTLHGIWEGIWGSIGNALKWVWDHILSPIFGAIQDALDAIGGAVKGVGDFFDWVFGHSIIVDAVRATRDELGSLIPEINRELLELGGFAGVGGAGAIGRTQLINIEINQEFGGVSTLFDWDEALNSLDRKLAQRLEMIP